MDNLRTGRVVAAVVGSPGTDPSDYRCSCNSAVAAALTSVAVDIPVVAFQPEDGTAAVHRRTDQACTAAADCTAALKHTHTHTPKTLHKHICNAYAKHCCKVGS